jgi:hypothetical protein
MRATLRLPFKRTRRGRDEQYRSPDPRPLHAELDPRRAEELLSGPLAVEAEIPWLIQLDGRPQLKPARRAEANLFVAAHLVLDEVREPDAVLEQTSVLGWLQLAIRKADRRRRSSSMASDSCGRITVRASAAGEQLASSTVCQ